MRRVIIIIVIILLVAAGGFAAYRTGLLNNTGLVGTSASSSGDATAPQTATAVSAADLAAARAVNNSVVADARVVPVEEASLSLSRSGIIKSILVREGERVTEGQLLLQLNAAQERVAVAQAQAELQRAEARLQETKAGPREAEIDSAQAALDAAQARYDRLTNASLPGNIADAEASVAGAQAGLAKVLEGASEEKLIAARADIASAEAELKRAQRAFNDVRWRPDAGATLESANLQKATIAYEAAKARLDDLQNGATQATVAEASAQVRRQQAQLNTLRDSMPQEINESAANVRASQAQLDLLIAGSRPEAIAAAEADVASATAALQQALVALSETELRAPFAGTVAQVLFNVGEQATPNTPIVQVADLSTWQIETEDLTELDIVGVNESTPVTITFDAIPDLEMSGKVRYINPLGKDNRGDIVYTVVIEPAQMDNRLRWNMTAVVELQTAQ